MDRRRVLVVDDSEDNANALAMVLEMHSYETLVEFNGPAALAAAATRRPDAVLLDLGLPGISGLELCKRIRGEPWGTEMMIIAVTGWAREEDRANARAAGFDHYVLKPVEFETVDALLKGIDRRHPDRQQKVPEWERRGE